ncbi:transcription antitermination protein nusG [Alkalispirochaeta americana]|uniref:Transcription termination/antitermination protein NusG n=1 Tax=Alkalispirochaeta americana TaxID=159291 RepID=A0A1N6NG49_9SPIO|nr:transcription termination/antitermination protein NusG [Alkalispirochaeta americana]SIP91023.1 transcription antitermination protein nusG [Alkalispirochaeta americana]
MAKNWYVLHTYSGYENKIERSIRMLMEEGKLGDAVIDIKVPAEDVEERTKDGKRRVTSKKFLPGYVLLEMDFPEVGWNSVLAQIKRINGVTGFVGSAPGAKPRPISQEEARVILQKTGEIKGDSVHRQKDSFVQGETVRITEGPFNTFTGVVEEANNEKSKLRVTVGIFGRSTPVELDFSQVEKI